MTPIEHFISRWSGREGGQERANYALFLSELCTVIGVPPPDPAGHASELNAYVFERAVTFREPDGSTAKGRIDLYKRGAFVLEAKQSRQGEGPKAAEAGQQDRPGVEEPAPQGRRESRRWDVLMMNARRQAEDYAKALPAAEGWPPFLIVCDVGHCLELYADFSGQGKNYAQFPDRRGFRIFLSDLRSEEVRERLRLIWTDPHALDPTKRAARVTRDIAERLAKVSKSLEERRAEDGRPLHAREAIAAFLMRCLFTMFAEDVELIPKDSFKGVLERCRGKPDLFPRLVGQLWEAMDKGGFAYAIEAQVKRFNGYLFKDRTVLPLPQEAIGELAEAARANWREVEPAIFGTLLEQALDPTERRKLGAHYTPRAYVERLVIATVIEPLREEWDHVRATAERLRAGGDPAGALAEVSKFHARLCAVRVLDPACGTGNFLYVALELMKRLEGEVLEALADLGGQETLGLDRHTVDPHQFLGLEVNPHAAAIAELVVWIGFLQWFFRTQGGQPAEPILRDFRTIRAMDAVLAHDGRDLVTDAAGRPVSRRDAAGERVEVYRYRNPRRPAWPEAEFIVGNPPFIGKGEPMRAAFGQAYLDALWAAHPHINESADFVMYWWDRAAELLTRHGTPLRRFGFVTTNSITQEFSRRVMAARLKAKKPVSLVMAIPDHPWTKATRDAAAVRIAMTVVVAGAHEGALREVVTEAELASETPIVDLSQRVGEINADLTIGADITASVKLSANAGLSSNGFLLAGRGFVITETDAQILGLGEIQGLEKHIRPYRNGRDLMTIPRKVMLIDLFGLKSEEVRGRFPSVYQHILATVKPERDQNNRDSYRRNWWIFAEPRSDLRPALDHLPRYIATPETAKHRVFQFVDGLVLPDHMVVAVASADAVHLGVLSSRAHVLWALRAGGWLGVGNDPRYSKSRVFDPFPFPDAPEPLKADIRAVAEELDAFRKARQAEHPRLTLTQMYNVLEKLRAGTALDENDVRIRDEGLVLILKELHDRLDALVFDAYGWPQDLSDEEIVARLVALNRERAKEEAAGLIRWLRPDYQKARAGLTGAVQPAEAQDSMALVVDAAKAQKPLFPTGEVERTAAVMAALASAAGPADAASIAAGFRQGRRAEPHIQATLASLARMGFASSPDGRRFMFRRVA
ncbi:class I SAM-dependent DNA methyltransferase [Prosthecomicrobium pneumaticum]|uniref:site-specific DNA-methyltransferase (adenine-specific) n=1 Tax=Prosthecomicrobium pneumaticum TaxID=81895 RepID=A0A7W9FNN1_9HYPH|nr:class I SAM-dependent DNA methyltransferase [Prosthecomicrobium pneumaticum]MBB5754047.1 SAM-dependent methyltransferase [Prosthecomicrobium pneumaticum]